MNKLVFIETSDIGARYSGEAARALGFEPIFICDLKNYQAETLKQIREFQHINMPTHDPNTIVKSLAGDSSIGGVMTFLDSRLEVAIDVAQLLGVRGLEANIKKLKDKGSACELSNKLMPPTLQVTPILSDDVWIPFFQRHGKCILKPRKTAGAIGAKTFKWPVSREELIRHMKDTQIPDVLDPDGWILQAFVEGELMSLEGYIHGGTIFPLGVTGRRKVGQSESVATFPDDHRLSASALRNVVHGCRELLARAQIHTCYFHIEFISGPSGQLIIDANVGRLGGGGVGELLALSYEIAPKDVFAHVIRVSLGFPSENPFIVRGRHATSICYGISRTAVVHEIQNLERLNGYHTLILDTGKEVPAMGENNWAWIGIATGLSSELTSQMDCVRIQTDHGDFTPCY